MQFVVELHQAPVRPRQLLLDAVQLVYLLINVDEQQHEEQRQDADQDQVVLQLGFGLGLLGLVDRVDDRIELRHLGRAELHVAEDRIFDGRLRVLESPRKIALVVVHQCQRVERGVLLHRALRIGDRREHEIFLFRLRVFVQPVETAVGIGRLRVERRVLADLFQQLVEDRPGFVHLAVSHEFVAQVYPVAERSRVGNHHQRVPVDIHFVQVAALAAQRGIVLEITVVGLVVDRKQVAREFGRSDGAEYLVRLDAHARKRVELGEVHVRQVGQPFVVQLPGDFEVPFDVADGRIQLVFPEFFVQLRIDLVFLFRGQVAYAQQVPQPADPLFLFGFENMLVLDYIVQVFREGLRLVLPARR